jgi:hypothetical protein
MKTRLLFPVIVATAAAFGASASAQSEPTDAQAQARALLNRPLVSEPSKAQEHRYTRSSATMDVHASAAALLSGRSSGSRASNSDHVASAVATKSLDAQAHAATLLRGSGIPVEEALRNTQISRQLEAHPAVRVAESWSTRAIDPNTFIVAHPARLQLLAASSTETPPASAGSVADARAAKLSAKLAK